MPTPSEQQMGGLAVGSPVPAIGAEAWVNGPPPADYDGKVIVVHGWFLNCPYCWEEAPGLGDLARSYAGSDVEFVGLSPDEVSRASAVQEFVEKGGLPYPVGFGARDALLGFEAEYFPAVWVVDRTGKVVWNKAYEPYVSLEEAIEQALAGDEPSA
ncbi:MAG: TlpA disulfide reductase family protein [Planctomycetota bacterium]